MGGEYGRVYVLGVGEGYLEARPLVGDLHLVYDGGAHDEAARAYVVAVEHHALAVAVYVAVHHAVYVALVYHTLLYLAHAVLEVLAGLVLVVAYELDWLARHGLSEHGGFHSLA